MGDIADFHTSLVDQIVEVDEELMETYLEAGEVAPEQLLQPFRRAMREGHLVPVGFASTRNDVGVSSLMHQIARLFPNPAEGNPRPLQRVREDGREALSLSPEPLWIRTKTWAESLFGFRTLKF